MFSGDLGRGECRRLWVMKMNAKHLREPKTGTWFIVRTFGSRWVGKQGRS